MSDNIGTNTSISFIDVYLKGNRILLILVFLSGLYPCIIAFFELDVHCQYEFLYGEVCRSCGLTRGLLECYKGDFSNAQLLNIQSFFFFIAIILQLIFRTVLFFISRKIYSEKAMYIIVGIDVITLIILFIANRLIYG